jgi:hypothetical protein
MHDKPTKKYLSALKLSGCIMTFPNTQVKLKQKAGNDGSWLMKLGSGGNPLHCVSFSSILIHCHLQFPICVGFCSLQECMCEARKYKSNKKPKQKSDQWFWRCNSFKKKKTTLTNFHNHVFCSLKVVRVHFDFANAGRYLKQYTYQRF